MKLPPAWSRVRIDEQGRRSLRLWLPVFLLWPVLLLLGGLALLIAVLVDAALVLGGRSYHRYSRLLVASFATVGEAKGMIVAVDGPGRTLHVEFR